MSSYASGGMSCYVSAGVGSHVSVVKSPRVHVDCDP